jgi:hypothetical protein
MLVHSSGGVSHGDNNVSEEHLTPRGRGWGHIRTTKRSREETSTDGKLASCGDFVCQKNGTRGLKSLDAADLSIEAIAGFTFVVSYVCAPCISLTYVCM